jgi:hypothetical protein
MIRGYRAQNKKGEMRKMAHKFWIPNSLYDELNKAATDKKLTLQEYLDQLLEGILFGNWEVLEKRKG